MISIWIPLEKIKETVMKHDPSKQNTSPVGKGKLCPFA
jgi:hypothetical protein